METPTKCSDRGLVYDVGSGLKSMQMARFEGEYGSLCAFVLFLLISMSFPVPLLVVGDEGGEGRLSW